MEKLQPGERLQPEELPLDYGQVAWMATTDRLTGLANRYGQEIHFNKMANNGHQLGIILFDVSNFKQVNERKNYQFGDLKIRETGTFLRDQMRDTDKISFEPSLTGRLGGDEFILIVDLSNRREDEEKVREALSPERSLERIVERISHSFVEHEPIVEYNDWARKHGIPRLALHSGWAVRQPGETFDHVKCVAEIVKDKTTETAEEHARLREEQRGPMRRFAISSLRRALYKLEDR